MFAAVVVVWRKNQFGDLPVITKYDHDGINRVLTRPAKSRKVLEFKKGIFQAWKVMENDWLWKVIEKSWNSTNRTWNFLTEE